ncbi:hypothetical protein GXW82_04945 [Streptacidiphilus sp. 4-A2]|nr:hypothetical protein [Streptacidiphilus sp. 4-A2]
MAAACVAGALSLEDAARVIVLRSGALATLPGPWPEWHCRRRSWTSI